MFLFGSKARGDDGPHSDVDVLIVLKERAEDKERSVVSDVVYDVLEACGVFLQVVVLSADQQVGRLLRLSPAGARDFLCKPFTQLELLQKVEEYADAAPAASPEQHLLLVYVRHHCRYIHTLAEVARPLGLSEKTVSRQITRATGLGFEAFLQQVRLEKARLLLEAREELTISEVAYEVGFSTPSGFSRLFRKQMGCTPRAYRLAQKVKDSPDRGRKKS